MTMSARIAPQSPSSFRLWKTNGIMCQKRTRNFTGEKILGLREEKKDRTRAQLLEAALDLIHKRGFEETTVADIAAAVSVSPRTLLRYFPTKEDVIVSWVQDGMTII